MHILQPRELNVLADFLCLSRPNLEHAYQLLPFLFRCLRLDERLRARAGRVAGGRGPAPRDPPLALRLKNVSPAASALIAAVALSKSGMPAAFLDSSHLSKGADTWNRYASAIGAWLSLSRHARGSRPSQLTTYASPAG